MAIFQWRSRRIKCCHAHVLQYFGSISITLDSTAFPWPKRLGAPHPENVACSQTSQFWTANSMGIGRRLAQHIQLILLIKLSRRAVGGRRWLIDAEIFFVHPREISLFILERYMVYHPWFKGCAGVTPRRHKPTSRACNSVATRGWSQITVTDYWPTTLIWAFRLTFVSLFLNRRISRQLFLY